ncbi:putative aryl-alcohol dehydrogenase protein [Ilyonectria robusta]
MKALHDVVMSGKVRYIGASSMWTWEFAQLQHIAELKGWTKFISMQNFYNLVYREEEREMIPFCKATGVGIIPWSPMARGLLTRPWGTAESERARGDKYSAVWNVGASSEVVGRVEQLAKKKGVSMAVLATAWVLHKGCSPILGLNKPERIEEAVGALQGPLLEGSFLSQAGAAALIVLHWPTIRAADQGLSCFVHCPPLVRPRPYMYVKVIISDLVRSRIGLASPCPDSRHMIRFSTLRRQTSPTVHGVRRTGLPPWYMVMTSSRAIHPLDRCAPVGVRLSSAM